VKTYLNKGLVIQFVDEKNRTSVEFRHDGGVADFLDAINAERKDQRVAHLPFVLEREDQDDGLRCHLALSWTEATDEDVRSFVNTIPTRDGGTHELGMLSAGGTAVLRFMETHDLVKKGMEIKREDIREGLTAVLAVCVHEPQFQGQTKGRLNNPGVKAQVESMVRPALENFLLKNKSVGDAIAARVIQAASAREASRAAASQVRRKTAISGRLNLPGKLHDCDSTDPEISELFIVEGDSAGGSAKQGRDRDVQAILPLKGKVLNAEQAGKAKVLDNKELTDIISALGCGMDDQYDPARLRYGKVILLTDADSDGHHIATLLLTFFYRHVQGLFADGRVYLACPPLYKVSWGKETFWASDDAARDRILASLPKNAKPNITRFKGLGEMPAKLLFETTLDPMRRRLLRVVVPDDDRPYTDRTVSDLMGKEPEARFKFIMEEAYTAKDIDI
jgi:DNA gyrase subunit B/topoisomerase-4 subunit B